MLVEFANMDVMCAFPTSPEGAGAAGALIRCPGYPAGANSVIVYFRCADCAVEAARAVQAGGKIEERKKSIGPYGHIALVADTEGTVVGLHSMK